MVGVHQGPDLKGDRCNGGPMVSGGGGSGIAGRGLGEGGGGRRGRQNQENIRRRQEVDGGHGVGEDSGDGRVVGEARKGMWSADMGRHGVWWCGGGEELELWWTSSARLPGIVVVVVPARAVQWRRARLSGELGGGFESSIDGFGS